MKKSIISLAMAAACSLSFAMPAPAPSADAKPTAAAAAPAAKVTVAVTGAKTVQANEPLVMWERGQQPAEPSFDKLFEVSGKSPTWKIVSLIEGPSQATVTMRSPHGQYSMRFGLANEMIAHLKVKQGDEITTETQRLGAGALIAFKHGKTPIGFMSSDNVDVVAK